MSKEYNVIEALNMPEGTKLECIFEDGSKSKYIVKGDKNPVLSNGVGAELSLNRKAANAKFIKIPKPLTFFEAMKLIEEGKKVTNEFRKTREGYFYKCKHGEYSLEIAYYSNNYCGPMDISVDDLSAKWYEYEE